jgi:ABC-2 type transport system permease protein
MGKFAYAAVGTLLVGEFLVNLSNVMLNMPWMIIVLHSVVIAIVALGLCSLSVGMGASMPNFRESDPSKIAVGFGGTVNLIMGLLYQIFIIVLMALPWHLIMAAADRSNSEFTIPRWLWAAMIGGGVLGITAIILPLRSGSKALRNMEF